MALVGERERERAQAALRRHFLAGRLDDTELSERLELTLRARTRGDLRRALRSLPAAWASLDDVVLPAVERGRAVVRLAAAFVAWVFGSAFLLLAFAAWLAAEGPSTFGLVFFPATWIVLTLLLRRHAVRTRRR
jgi:hypothetical protein